MNVFRAPPIVVIGLLASGCGGKAIVDGSNHTGAGGMTSSTTSSASSSQSTSSTSHTSTGVGGGAASCDTLHQDLQTKFEAAIACNPLINWISCDGQETVFNDCGCVYVANEHYPELAQAARNAYDAWVAEGCGPWDCYWCPPEPPAPWFCLGVEFDEGHCEPAYEL